MRRSLYDVAGRCISLHFDNGFHVLSIDTHESTSVKRGVMKTMSVTAVRVTIAEILAYALLTSVILMGLVLGAGAQSNAVYVNPPYSDPGAAQNISGTFTLTNGGLPSVATVTNAASQTLNARLSWSAPGITDSIPVTVTDASGKTVSLSNYYQWQTWAGNTVIILSYPISGKMTFMVGGARAPSPTPTATPTPAPGASPSYTQWDGTVNLEANARPSLADITSWWNAHPPFADGTPTPTPTPTPSPSPTPIPGSIQPAVALPSGYVLAFHDEFDEGANFNSTDIASNGPITGSVKWMAHTPNGTDFSNFYNSGTNGFPFSTNALSIGLPGVPANPSDGYLNIHGWKDDFVVGTTAGRAGMISSMDSAGHGFTCRYGYFEAKIWLPPITAGSPPNATGLWPAFWILTSNVIQNPQTIESEIDIMEAYSVDYTKYHCNIHAFNNATDPQGGGNRYTTVQAPVDLSQGWHVYSCLIQPDYVHFYLDGAEVFKALTGNADILPMFVMVDFAFGGGWADQQNWGTDPGSPQNPRPYSNSTNMRVQYVRVWDNPAMQ